MQEELLKIEGCKPVRKIRPDGRVDVLWYHRKTMTRLPDDPTSTPFKRAVERLNREQAQKAATLDATIGSLIRSYQGASDWKNLAEATRAVDVFYLTAIENEFGTMPLAAIDQKGARAMFLEWHEMLAEDHPRAADAKLARFARVLKFALDRELVGRNPISTFKRAYKANRADKIWLPEHFDALNKRAVPAMRFAAFLALHTGQRRGDILALRWAQYDGKGISVTQQKTGARVYIPCTKALKATLDARREFVETEAQGAAVGALHVLVSSRSLPYCVEGFRSAWSTALEVSSIEGLHFHDIRGTTVTMLAEAGATVPEIATITGHTFQSVTRILEAYLNRTKALAESAISKLELRMAQ